MGIVKNYDNLARWTVFTQAGEPSFGYRGHRSGGGHLLAGDDFLNYLTPHPSGSRFVYTSVVHLPSMNHLLRAAYCIHDDLLEGGVVNACPKDASHWTPWWDVKDFRQYVISKAETQHGEDIMDFYRKYINPSHTGDEVTAFFPQGARFAVSRETIQRRPKADYERLLATLSQHDDSYAGYYMEWLWSELFLGHKQPCQVPTNLAPVSHSDAMHMLTLRFPHSVERHLSSHRMLSASSGCTCGGVSGGISGGVSGGISGGISGGLSGGISGDISGGVSGSDCVCGDVSGDVSSDISGGNSDGISGGTSGDVSTGVSSTTSSTSLSTDSTSTVSSESTETTTTTSSLALDGDVKIAGVLEVEIDVEYKLEQEVVEDMFKRALAASLDVPLINVLKTTATEMSTVPASRRLQSLNTTRYEVAYEVMVPSHMDVDEVIQKANRIAEPGSAESNLFRQVLTATDGVAQVRQIVAKVPAGRVEITTPSPESEEEKSWTGLVVGGILVLLLMVFVVTGAVMYKFKWNSETKESAKAGLNNDVETGTNLTDVVPESNASIDHIKVDVKDGAPQSHTAVDDEEECTI